RHGSQLPSRLSPANRPLRVPHSLQRQEVSARGHYYNEVPAGFVGMALSRRIPGRRADGMTVRPATRGRTPPPRPWEGRVRLDCPPRSLHEPGTPRPALVVPAHGLPPGSWTACAWGTQPDELAHTAGRD